MFCCRFPINEFGSTFKTPLNGAWRNRLNGVAQEIFVFTDIHCVKAVDSFPSYLTKTSLKRANVLPVTRSATTLSFPPIPETWQPLFIVYAPRSFFMVYPCKTSATLRKVFACLFISSHLYTPTPPPLQAVVRSCVRSFWDTTVTMEESKRLWGIAKTTWWLSSADLVERSVPWREPKPLRSRDERSCFRCCWLVSGRTKGVFCG